MLATLKSALGDGGSFFGDSHGEDNLYKVLKALAEEGAPLNARQATIATGIIGGMLVDKATKGVALRIAIGTTGDSGSTSVRAKLNGTLTGATATIANTAADGTKAAVALDIALVAGDLLEIEVTAAATNAADLTASIHTRDVTVE